jgi:hypothetical protein
MSNFEFHFDFLGFIILVKIMVVLKYYRNNLWCNLWYLSNIIELVSPFRLHYYLINHLKKHFKSRSYTTDHLI